MACLPLNHSHMRLVCIRKIGEVFTPREGADTIERSKKILAYLIHRRSREVLRRNRGFWGKGERK